MIFYCGNLDLAVGMPEVCAVNCNVLHTKTLLHAMLRQLNIAGKHFLSVSKARELSVLSDVYSGPGDDAEDTLSERSSSMPISFSRSKLQTYKRN